MSRSITINTDASRLHACRPVNASRSSHQHLSLRASSSLSPALVRVQDRAKILHSASRPECAEWRPRPYGMHISQSRRRPRLLTQAGAAEESAGANFRLLRYMTYISASGHQHLSGLIAFRRRVEAFVSDCLRAGRATHTLVYIIHHSGTECATAFSQRLRQSSVHGSVQVRKWHRVFSRLFEQTLMRRAMCEQTGTSYVYWKYAILT